MKQIIRSNFDPMLEDEWDIFGGFEYMVSGASVNPYGEIESKSRDVYTNDPEQAIEAWFKLNRSCRSGAAIHARTRAGACEIVDYAAENLDWVMLLHRKYRCNYSPEFLEDAILKQSANRCKTFYETEYGDMVFPFDVG